MLRKGLLPSVAVGLLGTTLVAGAWAAKDDTVLVSRASGAGGAKGDGQSLSPSVSADGRFVAFDSTASNLTPEDRDNKVDVFVRDLVANTTVLVSRATGAGPKGDADSFSASISGDGRFVAFRSDASNLAPTDTDSTPDVFVRDMQAGTTTLVSRASTGTKGNGPSVSPSISADGRSVAFESSASNLSGDDTDAVRDVFVRDLSASTTRLVSRAGGPTGPKGDNGSSSPSLSADGHFVAFESSATNLSPDDGDATSDVFARNLQTNATILVSRATTATGLKGNGSSSSPSITSDGRFVGFETSANNLSPDDGDAISDVFVRDLQASTTTLVSRPGPAAAGKGNGPSLSPSLSADGRFIAFASAASNLSPDDSDTRADVFVRDIQAGATGLVSRASGATGTKGNGDSFSPSLSADAHFVAFPSSATNLSPSDTDPVQDVFLRDIGSVSGTGAGPSTGGGSAAAGAGSAGLLATDSAAPVVQRFLMTRTRFAVSRKATPRTARRVKRGTAFLYRLSEDANVDIRIARRVSGVKLRSRGKLRCRARTRGVLRALRRQLSRTRSVRRVRGLARERTVERLMRRRSCKRDRSMGRLKRGAREGKNKTGFTGRIGSKPLRRGRYTAVIHATDRAGNRSRARSTRFRIVSSGAHRR